MDRFAGVRCEVNLLTRGTATQVELSGIIDETFTYADILKTTSRVVVFDLGGVHRISSFGVRGWIDMLSQLGAAYHCFVRCHPTIVAQFNMIKGFGVRGELITFYAPYSCIVCERERMMLLDMRQHFHMIEQLEPLEMNCECGSPMELDSIPEMYFQYLRSAPRPNPPAAAISLIDRTNRGAKAKIEKDIDASVTALWLSGSLTDRRYFKHLADGIEGDVLLMLSGVREANDEGIAAMLEFSTQCSAMVHLGRVPEHVWLLVGRMVAESTAATVRVVSAMMPAVCRDCTRATEVEVCASELIGESLPAGHPCACGETVKPEFPIHAGPPLEFVSPGTSHIRAYMDSHPDGPTGIKSVRSSSFLEQYKIIEQIGLGGMGEVFLAHKSGPSGFDKQVVLKRMRADHVGEPDLVEQFLQEARVMASLQHSNIVQVLDLGITDNQYVIVMEYVKGIDLYLLLRLASRSNKLIPVEICCFMIAKLCSALQAAHGFVDANGTHRPIVHRDVSPDNVLLSHAGEVKLTDFGVCKPADPVISREPSDFKGKESYAAPEQLRGETVDERADLFSAGVLLYECLTLERLFPGNDAATAAVAVQECPIPHLADKRNDIPPGLQEILEHALSRNTDQRYQRAQDLQQDLQKVIATLGRTATSLELGEMMARVRAPASDTRPGTTEAGSPNALRQRPLI